MPTSRPQRPAPGHAMLLPRVGDDQTQRALDSVKVTAAAIQKTAAGLQDQIDGARVTGTAPPTSGFHERAEIVWNSAPVSGGFIGWVCTAAGTPGTWKTWGPIS